MKASAAPAGSGVGPAEPMQVATRRSCGQSARPTEQTAITIALRVPNLANCCGPVARASSNAVISSSGASPVRFGPVTNSATATRRVPCTEATSTTASDVYRGGRPSPAGEAVARFPPTVPRLRICGEPTQRLAIASPGRRSPSSSIRRV